MTKIISWNVNGIRACIKKGFLDFLESECPDVCCLQEVKAHFEDVQKLLDEVSKKYNIFWNNAERKGYSGTAILTKKKPFDVENGFGISKYDYEGRVQIAEFEKYYLLNVYFPNAQRDMGRLEYKLDFYRDLFDFCNKLKAAKNIVICGDYNTAHKPIDLARPEQNEENTGFLPIEREWLDKITDYGYVDTFRMFNNEPDNYTWWSYMFNARKNNVGWRIDYFFVDDKFRKKVKNSYILRDVMGSDHCPIVLEIKESTINN
ncbi:exodeoxyribonuclease III [bacterium]